MSTYQDKRWQNIKDNYAPMTIEYLKKQTSLSGTEKVDNKRRGDFVLEYKMDGEAIK